MGKNLVIVESPAKAKTIEGYLGKDFKVVSSMGHIRDLPKGGGAIDIENGYEPTYEVSPDKKDVISTLKKLAKDAETVYLASDEDREGEAISWHLKEVLDLNDSKTRRIVFTEITKKAILNAIESPRGIDVDLVNILQSRYPVHEDNRDIVVCEEVKVRIIRCLHGKGYDQRGDTAVIQGLEVLYLQLGAVVGLRDNDMIASLFCCILDPCNE